MMRSMYKNKKLLLAYFREKAEGFLDKLQARTDNYKEKAKHINNYIKKIKEEHIVSMLISAKEEKWRNDEILDAKLNLIYVTDIVMLEFRNRVWPYEYMAFSRRIGELWELFCKEIFNYPLKKLDIVKPPEFREIQEKLKNNAESYIDSLTLNSDVKRKLYYHYNLPWMMVGSGDIQLELDLHFLQEDIYYNCDFKSGFSSNEKGNVNRLLLVSSIYNLLGENIKSLLFVRQEEQENNHYLQRLINSGYWKVYCANKAYEKMYEFTGFNIRAWIDQNISWLDDIDLQLKSQWEKEDIIRYLTW